MNFIKINYKGTELNLRNAVEKMDNSYYMELRSTEKIWITIHSNTHADMQKMNLSLQEITDLYNTYLLDINIYKMYLRFIRKEELGESDFRFLLLEELKNAIRYWGNRKGSRVIPATPTTESNTIVLDILAEEILEEEEEVAQILYLSPSKEIPTPAPSKKKSTNRKVSNRK